MSLSTKIRLGTRASQLALWQSNWVKSQLQSGGYEVELIEIRTEGDDRTQPLSQIGGQGLFTKRLQLALVNSEIDLAVHSLKDLPTEDHPDLKIAVIPPRETTADALITNRASSFLTMPAGSVVGTGSVRRAAQLRYLRDDIEIKDIRGNVDTRLKKLDAGDYDAIVLAAAGLTRLGWSDRIGYRFPAHELAPAIGQGALGLETRCDDTRIIEALRPLNDEPSYAAAKAERSMLRTLFAGCLSPVGAETHVRGQELTLRGVVLSHDGRKKIETTRTAPRGQYEKLGVEVAQSLLSQGADAILRREPSPGNLQE